MLLVQNMGEKLSIDESMHQKDLFTFLSNKDGHGKKGTLIAAIRGTKASVVAEHLMKIPEDKRLAVKEVTMDYSDSMYSIVTQVFPNADIVIDCFHVMKNQLDGLDAIRMRFKRKAIAEQSKEKKEFNRKRKPAKRPEPDIARHIQRSLARNAEDQDCVPTRSLCQWNCLTATPRSSCLPASRESSHRVERNGAKVRRSEPTWYLSLRQS